MCEGKTKYAFRRQQRENISGQKCSSFPFALEDYILFDCPGQVELFTHHASLRNILFRIQKLGYRVSISLMLFPVNIFPQFHMTTDPPIARGPALNRLVHPFPALTLHIHTASIPAVNATDGPADT